MSKSTQDLCHDLAKRADSFFICNTNKLKKQEMGFKIKKVGISPLILHYAKNPKDGQKGTGALFLICLSLIYLFTYLSIPAQVDPFVSCLPDSYTQKYHQVAIQDVYI